MANLPRISPFGDRESLNSLSVEEFVPPSAWTEDQTCHYLLVDLPGFKKQELKLQVDNQTHIVVSGERQVRENKFKRFEQRFELPNNVHIDKISGKLDGEILYISVPKKVEHEHQETKHDGIHGGKTAMSDDGEDDDGDDDKEEKSDDDGDDDKEEKSYANENEEESDNKDEKDLERNKHRMEFDEDWGKEADLYLRLAIEKLIKNKEIVMTAIFAFSLGVLVSQKFQSDGH
ncbi:HSP20-like chaperone [Artemisia annua]|uniref:HSP20-like chaperone n=1 Tax=Artemisia annua TaxID=35608 RepID=A0A2U1L255_ARTAN|nr:HSP20-like chaperone [Artemisia annua]